MTTYSLIDKTTKLVKKDDDGIDLTVNANDVDWLYAVEGRMNDYKSNGRYYVKKNNN